MTLRGDTSLGRKGTSLQFHQYHHRRPINVGVIAGDLWQAHDRAGADNGVRANRR